MKLVIQIPCFNEAKTLPLLFQDMPRKIKGIDCIEIQVIDDGSTDQTENVARELGVNYIVSVSCQNSRWLGRAFKIGVDHALKVGADILVNTDGDNQYPSSAIADLIAPIIEKKADLVIGNRDPSHWRFFSPTKRLLQWLGNRFVSFLCRKPVPDAVSGFRAYSRESLLRINVITNYTYTVDTLIQAYKKGLTVVWLPITANPPTRESRLIKSSFEKVWRSGLNILRLIIVYDPFRTFTTAAAIFFLPAATLLGRFLYFYFFRHESAAGHIQSVVIGGAFLVIAVQLQIFGILSGLLSVNRILLEDTLLRLKRQELENMQDRAEIDQKQAKVVNF